MSKFDKIFEARETEQKTPGDIAPPATKPKKAPAPAKKAITPPVSKAKPPAVNAGHSTDAVMDTTQSASLTDGPRRGRPPAKRSDPNFIGFTTYVRKDTHLKVKIALLQEGQGRELSQLVEELLAGWVKNI